MCDRGPILIVAASGRALAASARRAGVRIAVLDLFRDTDLAELTPACARVRRGRPDGFDEAALTAAADRLAPPHSRPRWGLVYGSGFDGRPAQLARLAEGRRIYGNAPGTLAAAKDPRAFAARLARLGLPHPETRLEPPPAADADGWLVKRAGGSGGLHVRPAGPPGPGGAAGIAGGDGAAAGGEAGAHYYQRRIDGRAVSALVLADGRRARVLGLSEQWPAPGCAARPFRYGGAAAPAAVPPALARDLAEAAVAVATDLGLAGLNSVDFVVRGEAPGAFVLIEVNPRPGATVDVFERAGGTPLFDLHLRAAAGALPAPEGDPRFPPGAAAAGAVLYSQQAVRVPKGLAWPAWTADRPRAGERIGADEPVCTVLAEVPGADSGADAGAGARAGARAGESSPAARARRLALARAEALRAMIGGCMQSSPPPGGGDGARPSVPEDSGRHRDSRQHRGDCHGR